jgi:MerR family copper efflux transcriptional regulator
MLISELARKTQVSSHTIRFYEKIGLISERFVERGENNYRIYTEEAAERIEVIKILCSTGFTLSEIKELMDKWDAGDLTPQAGRIFLQKKIDKLDARIEELRQVKLTLIEKLGVHLKQAAEEDQAP